MKYVCLTRFDIEHNRGGSELMLHARLSELAKRHEVTVLITDTQSADVNIDGVNVRYTRDRTTDLLSTNPDVIMAQFYNAEHAFEMSRSNGVRLS